MRKFFSKPDDVSTGQQVMKSTKAKRLQCFLTIFSASLLVVLTGCGMFEAHKKPRIAETPPYYEQHDRSTDFRTYHDRERDNMANQVHIVRNREMERLAEIGKEEEKNRKWSEEEKTTQEKREKFWDKFKFSDKNFLRSEEASRISSNLDR